MCYIDKLIHNCELAKKAVPVREFELTSLDDADGIKKAIYIIEEIGGDIESTFQNFKEYKATKTRKCSQPNAASIVMYVGSSTTGLRKRLEQHKGVGYKNVYALHLKEWFNGAHKITVKVYDVERAVLQIIEDDLSDRLKPAFGKLGSNNK